jgi:hypothetical protein
MNKYISLIDAINSYYLCTTAHKVHGPYKKRNGRQFVVIINDDGSRRTVSYPKFLVEQHLGRTLHPDLETIDHIDGNFNNNNLNNLRIIPRDEHSADDTRRVKHEIFTCAWCNKEFKRSPRLIRDKSKNKKAGPFCSRQCAGRYSRLLQLKLIDKFDIQPYIGSTYYKKKNINNISSDFV